MHHFCVVWKMQENTDAADVSLSEDSTITMNAQMTSDVIERPILNHT